MSSTYAGDPDNFPEDFVIPDDADPPTAAAFNVAIEALGDRTAFLAARAAKPVYVEFLADGSITFPEGCAPFCIIEACGQGGSGGDGANNPGADYHASGGGGGGGAIMSRRTVVIVPGEQYDITIGSSAGSGTAGANADGQDGANTVFTRTSTATVLATWTGGSGGQAGKVDTVGGPNGCVRAYGGGPILSGGGLPQASSFDSSTDPVLLEIHSWVGIPQHGADGLTSNFPSWARNLNGAQSPQGWNGGLHGTHDTTSSGSYRGGGGGGGGGGGPYGSGGFGGAGGSANNAGSSSGGTAGNAGAANTGGGGGGGGGSGGATGSGQGGAGHKGGSGRMRIVYFVAMTEP